MKTSLTYIHEKLIETISSITIGEGDARSRLAKSSIIFAPLIGKTFPEKYQSRWDSIEKGLTRFGPVYDYHGSVRIGSIQNTMNRIKNKTAVKIIESIVELNFLIEDEI